MNNVEQENELYRLDDPALDRRTREAARAENRSTSAVLVHLREVERRRLHARLGYASVFEYCVKRLGYSEGGAAERVAAMRFVAGVPEARQELERGTLSLTVIAKLGRFVRQEEKAGKQIWGEDRKRALVKEFSGKSVREAEEALLLRSSAPPMADPPKERLRRVKCGGVTPALRCETSAPGNPATGNPVNAAAAPAAAAAAAAPAAAATVPELTGGFAPGVPSDPGDRPASDLPAKPRIVTQLTLTLDAELEDLLTRYRELRGPGSYTEVFKSALHYYVARHDPLAPRADGRSKPKRESPEPSSPSADHAERQAPDGPEHATRAPAQERAATRAPVLKSDGITSGSESLPQGSTTELRGSMAEASRSRYLPAAVRREVAHRSGGRCEYIDSSKARRCESRSRLEYDHRVPFSQGGAASAENIRHFCKPHNLLAAIDTLGPPLMQRYLRC